MDKPHYQYKISADGQYYFFDSIGKSTIPKVVGYLLRNVDTEFVELIFGILDDEHYEFFNKDHQYQAYIIRKK